MSSRALPLALSTLLASSSLASCSSSDTAAADNGTGGASLITGGSSSKGGAGGTGGALSGGAAGKAGAGGGGGAAGVTGCASKTLCGPKATCCDVGSECVDAACVPACTSGIRCGVGSATCCAAGQACVATQCVTPKGKCSDFFDCGDNEFCEPTLGKCLPQFPGSNQCEVKPPPFKVEPILKWELTTPTALPSFNQGISAPLVVDLDKDGTPDVVTSMRAASQANENQGYVRALDGKTGKEKWAASVDAFKPGNEVDCTTAMIVADLKGNGKIAIVAESIDGHLIAFDGDGSLRWKSVKGGLVPHSAIAVADVDGDGTGEIALGGVLFDSNGVVLSGDGREAAGGIGYGGAVAPYGVSTILADVDGDGKQELVTGNAAYRIDGSAVWSQSALSDGLPAIADFEKDGVPELVVSAAGNTLRIHNAKTGVVATSIALGGDNAGPPVLADYDGDGALDIGIQRDKPCNYSVYKYKAGALTLAWTTQLTKCSGFFAATAFDFNGDGSAEVVTHDDCYVSVLDGKTGAKVFDLPAPHDTWSEFVSVADVDGDGSADLIFPANDFYHLQNPGYCPYPPAMLRHGIFAYSSKGPKWMPTRRVWNEQSYHITNIKVDGSLPKPEVASWGPSGYDNYRVSFQGAGVFNAPDLAVDLEVSTSTCPSGVLLRARVKNLGSLGVAAGVAVVFHAGKDAAAPTLGMAVTKGPILPGGSEVVELATSGPTGAGDFFVTVDGGATSGAGGVVSECNEANNTASTGAALCPSGPG